MTYTLRNATPEDAVTIARFNQLMARETEDKELPDEKILPGVKALLEDPVKGRYFVAEQDGQLVGQIMITYEWSDWRNATIWWIQSVYVRSDMRRKGIYRALYDKVREEAEKAGIETLRLYVERNNRVAQQVYEQLGMEETVYLLYEASLPQSSQKQD